MPPLGRRHSAETRAKIAASHRGKSKSAEWRRHLSEANRGKRASDEARAKMSAAGRGRKKSPEHVAKIAAALRATKAGKPPAWWLRLSDSDRKALVVRRNNSLRKSWANQEVRQRRISVCVANAALATAASQAKWDTSTEEEKRRRTEAMRQASPKKTRERWLAMSGEERLAKLRKMWMASRGQRPTSIERAVASVLDVLGVQYFAEHPIGSYTVDFYIPGRRLVVECDGAYWHSRPEQRAHDEKRDAWMKSRGYSVLRLPEAEIRSGAALSRLSEVA